MTRNVEAVYINGVLRPLHPIDLAENQKVTLTISNGAHAAHDEDGLDHEFMAYIESQADDSVTLEEVRAALAKFDGKMSDVIRAERDED